ncbi:MAG: hypothetical protein Kow00121_49000 [Elainellaceae cyanobacterium]
MRPSWSDPYLWVHLAGIAAVPVLLELCLLGLATGEPNFATWFELLFVGSIGILPVFWMQWQRPFCIFSLLAFALKPSHLTDEQRRTLRLFKSPLNRVLSILTAGIMVWVLWQLYQLAPIASPGIFPTANRGIGLLIAAIAFWASNLFLQVPISVLPVLLTPERQRAALEPYPAAQIPQDFTVPGIRVSQILPPLRTPAPSNLDSASTAPKTSPPPAATAVVPGSSQPGAVQSSATNEPTDSLVAAVEITEADAVPDGFEEVTTEDGEDDYSFDTLELQQEELPSAHASSMPTATQSFEERSLEEPSSEEQLSEEQLPEERSFEEETIAPALDQASPTGGMYLQEESMVTEEIIVEILPQPQSEESPANFKPPADPDAQEDERIEASETETAEAAESIVAEIEDPDAAKWEVTEPPRSVSISEAVAIVEDETLAETYDLDPTDTKANIGVDISADTNTADTNTNANASNDDNNFD